MSAARISLSNAQSEYIDWTDKAVRIRVSTQAMQDLIAAATAGSGASDSDRGMETGGLLLGSPGDPLTIEGIEPVACEHRRGLSYTLSAKDRKALASRLAKRRRNVEVVGFYRSHTRPGLYLDEDDYGVMKEHLAGASQIALLVKPWAGRGQIAGVFLWEDGEIARRAPRAQFAMDPGPQEVMATRPQVWPLEAKSVTRPVRVWPALPGRAGGARRYWREIAAGTAVFVGVGILIGGSVALLERRSWQRPVTARGDIDMVVTRAGDGFRVTWNRDSRNLAGANGAVLLIDDGGRQRRLELGPHEVRSGSVTYYPVSESVTVRMEPAAPRPTPAAAPAPPAPSPNVIEQPLAAKAARSRAAKPAPRPFRMEEATRNVGSAERQEMLEPPPAIDAVAGARAVPGITPRRRAPAFLAAVTHEPVRPHSLRRVVNRIPGLRALQRSRYKDGPGFTPAHPLRRVAPPIPAGLKRTQAELELKVYIDKSGRVSRTEVVSEEADGNLKRLAVNAAKEWEFSAARMKDKVVESEMTLRFDFDPARASERASAR